MKNDERIQTTISHITRRVFSIWFLLMSISLNYRIWILKQHPRQWWDIFAIFVIGIIYGFIAFANKGVFFPLSKWGWLALCIFLFVLFLIKGQIHSVGDVAGFLIGILIAMGLLITATHFLNRRWERKEGIEDEK